MFEQLIQNRRNANESHQRKSEKISLNYYGNSKSRPFSRQEANNNPILKNKELNRESLNFFSNEDDADLVKIKNSLENSYDDGMNEVEEEVEQKLEP